MNVTPPLSFPPAPPRPAPPRPARSLGDLDFKEPRRFVECEPDVRRLVPQPGDNLVVLGSDGLWDVMGDQEAVDVANAALTVGAGWDGCWVGGCVGGWVGGEGGWVGGWVGARVGGEGGEWVVVFTFTGVRCLYVCGGRGAGLGLGVAALVVCDASAQKVLTC